MSILKKVWGETIKKIGVLMVLAIALLSAPALGLNDDILEDGIIEAGIVAEGNIFKLNFFQNTNFDSINVGNDKAFAVGWLCTSDDADAENNLEIIKNQDSGDAGSLYTNEVNPETGASTVALQDAKVNLEQIKVGNREAMAFGHADAENNVKIATNQQ